MATRRSLTRSRSTVEDMRELGKCSHVHDAVRNVALARCKRLIRAPDEWLCSTCSSTNALTLCLSCALCHCELHPCRRGKLFIALNTARHSWGCSPCNVSAQTTSALPAGTPVRVLRELLERCRSCKEMPTFMDCAVIAARKEDDCMDAACCFWRERLLRKCFLAWKESHEEDEEVSLARPPPLLHRSRSVVPRTFLSTFANGRTGLRNLGNTCYMNATLQAMGHVAAFRHWVLAQSKLDTQPTEEKEELLPPTLKRQSSAQLMRQVKKKLKAVIQEEEEEDEGHAVTRELVRTYHHLWAGKQVVYTPDELLIAVWNSNKQFRNFEQHDAQEFLLFLFSQLDQSFVRANLSVTLGNHLQCDGCGHQRVSSTTGATVLTLHLPAESDWVSSMQHPTIVETDCNGNGNGARRRRQQRTCARNYSLYELLEYELSSERLDGVYCESCDGKHSHSKQLVIENNPSLIVFHIVRTKFSPKTRRMTKMSNRLLLPLDNLDLAPFKSNNRTGGESAMYDCTGIVCHVGRSAQQGHYYCFAFNARYETWTLLNDKVVSSVPASRVQADAKTQSYLLFYERK